MRDTHKSINRLTLDLISACESNDMSLVEKCLNQGVDPNACDYYGHLPLCVAARYGDVKVVELLLSKGAFIHARDQDSKMPIHWACSGNLKVVEFLIKKNAKIDARCAKDRAAPLHIAISEPVDEVVQKGIVGLLLEAGADMEGLDAKGCTPLLMAAQRGLSFVVSELLDFGALIDIHHERTGETALMLAASCGSAKTVAALLADKAKVDLLDKDGWSALRHAAKSGNVKCCEFLMNAGAKHGELCIVGKSPVEAARENGHKELADWLSAARIANDEKSEIIAVVNKSEENRQGKIKKTRL